MSYFFTEDYSDCCMSANLTFFMITHFPIRVYQEVQTRDLGLGESGLFGLQNTHHVA